MFFFLKNLTLEIYTIGYKREGESIVFFIKTDNQIAYSGVIDCFEYNSINKTAEILMKNAVNKIDFLCWTHPDLDHSLGLDTILNQFVDFNTKIALPENISGQEFSYHSSVKASFDFIQDKIKPRPGRKKFDVKSASDYKYLVWLDFKGPVLTYQMTIHSIAPNSTIVRSRSLSTSTPKKNDYSVALMLNLGEVNILLGGDVENATINKFEEFYIPEKLDYIKVPHHTSKSSDKLLLYLSQELKVEVACTTLYETHELPNTELLKIYLDYVN